MRLFAAVEIPPGSADPNLEVRPERHLTLRFFGERPAEVVPTLAVALDRCAAATAPFELGLRGGGAFPSPERPRVVWIGVGTGHPELLALAERLEAELAREGIPRGPAPFVPHVTVLRVRGPAQRPRAQAVLRALGDRELGRLRVEEVTLFESELTPHGAIHRPLHTARLAGGGSRPPSADVR
jgi:2'-5' RNA ligase